MTATLEVVLALAYAIVLARRRPGAATVSAPAPRAWRSRSPLAFAVGDRLPVNAVIAACSPGALCWSSVLRVLGAVPRSSCRPSGAQARRLR